ncbi:hypothetical protein SAMN05216359_105308 [Roseateles sp. YR242]|uniref:hypothetical protein n=1 Tax=Roseateles sp. YR242 TaxID=1855305 RepID=UPI0008C32923|nr:hypothetical protein [Roseateles sp. YR242]SEL13076.1 hypothetical protein SAMN05216359_105308 [Roseateles sp. YR242]
MCFAQRKEAVSQFLALDMVPRADAVVAVAHQFGVTTDEVCVAIESAAVCQFLWALREADVPPREVLYATARHFRFSDADLQAAIDRHTESVEAI